MPRASPRLRALQLVQADTVACERCERLRTYCEGVAREKRAAYREQTYWGKPVPGFGDVDARILVMGLAPAAHGGNRTGRVFTGDRSGDFLYEALHRAGLANQPTAVSRDDGLKLTGVYVAAAARCAPPANKPLPTEIDACLEYLERELKILTELRVALSLGKIGHDALIKAFRRRALLTGKERYEFAHGAVHRLPAPLPAIVCSYHVSQQNTFTGRLTKAMFDRVIAQAKEIAGL